MNPLYTPHNREYFTAEQWYSFHVTCLAAPLQISGTINGIPMYYRERHDRWTIETPEHTFSGDSNPNMNEDIALAMSRMISAGEQLG